MSRVVPPKDIEDIVQETYVRLCAGLDEHEAWLTVDSDPQADATYATAAANEEFVLFCDAVRHLPP